MKMLFRTAVLFLSLWAVARATEAQPVQWTVAFDRAPVVGAEIEVVITARIAPAWIVYSSDFKADLGPQPTRFVFDQTDAFRLVGEVASVAPLRKKDKAWDVEFGYFETRAEFRQKIKVLQPSPTIAGRIKGQLCNERGGTCTLFEHVFQL